VHRASAHEKTGEKVRLRIIMRMGRILAGLDLEQDTEKVLAYASFFAKALGAPLHLLHVIDFLVTPPTYLSRYMEEEKKAAEEKFIPWGKMLANEGVKAAMEVVIGRLHESFGSATEKAHAGMLVIGYKSHVFRRSSSETLIKSLELPMLVVRGERAESAKIGSVKIGRILCPTDFSETSGKALAAAKDLTEVFSSEMDVLHVFPGHVIEKKMGERKEKDRVMDELFQQAKSGLSKLLGDAGIAKEGIVIEGEPHKRISSFSSENDIDLIVIGARGLSFIRGMLIGSVTDAVLKASPCPVLVIH
jgi:nucleotide-binding universal stress UspA family protein